MQSSAVMSRRLAFAAIIILLPGCTEEPAPRAASQAVVTGNSPLVSAFRDAERQTHVPAALLASLAYVETRFSQSVGYDADLDHGMPRSLGVMALSESQPSRDARHAAALVRATPEKLRDDAATNILAAAALLAEYARDEYGEVPPTIEAYRGALGRYAGDALTAATLADDVLSNIERGIDGYDDDGAHILVPAFALSGSESGIGQASLALYSGAIWSPAYSGNYQTASRGAAQINYIVIHTTQGSYAGTVSWFKNPAAKVSAHYVVRSSDGQITQMVDDKNIAWHDACFNSQSIGIEHEGFVADPGRWYTDAMYRSSARLTAYLADKYGVPKDRAHIQGHGETADCSDHTDPGSGWNWTKYMDLVRGGGAPTAPAYAATAGAQSPIPVLRSGEEAVAWVEFKNSGTATWDVNDTRLGTAEPQDRTSGFFKSGNWLSPNRATGADHTGYGPNATGRFSFVIKAPIVTKETVFHEKFRLVQEGVTWFGPVVELTITVRPTTTTNAATPGAVVGEPLPASEVDLPAEVPEATIPEGSLPTTDPGTPAGACSVSAGGRSSHSAALVTLVLALAVLVVVRRRRSLLP